MITSAKSSGHSPSSSVFLYLSILRTLSSDPNTEITGVLSSLVGYDASNSGDDRLYGFGEDFTPSNNVLEGGLEIRNPRLVDSSRDGVLVRGEEARMVFEIYNTSDKVIRSVQPAVAEVTGNKHIHISENILIESIAPGKGVRYTASIKGDNGLRDGEAVIRIGVLQANKEVSSQTRNFTIVTRKK